MLALVRQEEEEEPVVEFLICDLIRNHAGLVGANGRSPEKGPRWNLCLLLEKWDMRRIVSPYFRSHLLVSEANVSDVLFLGFYSDQRVLVHKRRADISCEIPCSFPEQNLFRADSTR